MVQVDSMHEIQFSFMCPLFIVSDFLIQSWLLLSLRPAQLWSAPLLVSTDVCELTEEKKSILMNTDVLAVHKDPLFVAGECGACYIVLWVLCYVVHNVTM